MGLLNSCDKVMFLDKVEQRDIQGHLCFSQHRPTRTRLWGRNNLHIFRLWLYCNPVMRPCVRILNSLAFILDSYTCMRKFKKLVYLLHLFFCESALWWFDRNGCEKTLNLNTSTLKIYCSKQTRQRHFLQVLRLESSLIITHTLEWKNYG